MTQCSSEDTLLATTQQLPLFPGGPNLTEELVVYEPTLMNGNAHLMLDLNGIGPSGTKPSDLFIETVEESPEETNPEIKETVIDRNLSIVEVYQLSSFLGRSAIGKLINTFTLLPGEESTVTIRTFSRIASTKNQSSSIVDSYSKETEDRFYDERKRESGYLKYREVNEAISAKAGGTGFWGWGTASASAGTNRDTHDKRTDFSKDFMKSVRNHTQKASSSRHIQIGTSESQETVNERYESVERKLKNPNINRTLSYKFKQINQEFNVALQLVDVKIAYSKKDKLKQAIYETYSLEDLEQLLIDKIKAEYIDEVRKRIENMMLLKVHKQDNLDLTKRTDDVCSDDEILDFELKCVAERVSIDNLGNETISDVCNTVGPVVNSYVRFKKNKTKVTYKTDDINPGELCLPGYLVRFNIHKVLTDGVRIDPYVGTQDALDGHGLSLQQNILNQMEKDNQMREVLRKREELAQDLFRQIFRDPHLGIDVKVQFFRSIFEDLESHYPINKSIQQDNFFENNTHIAFDKNVSNSEGR
ncbi:hypothetical protein D3C74_228270 [compost metagenome]